MSADNNDDDVGEFSAYTELTDIQKKYVQLQIAYDKLKSSNESLKLSVTKARDGYK